MKARLLLACAAAGIAAVATSTTASADNSDIGRIGLNPDVAQPGQPVSITGTCSAKGFVSAPVISEVLDAGVLAGHDTGSGSGAAMFTSGIVKANAKQGTWKVAFQCGSTEVATTLRVVGDPVAPNVSVHPTRGVAGTKATVWVRCDREPSGISSAALTIGKRTGKPEETWYGTFATAKDVKPGVYKVTAKCGAKDVSTTFTIVPAKSNAQVPVKPKGAAETGALLDAS
jgi:hypothetical protein